MRALVLRVIVLACAFALMLGTPLGCRGKAAGLLRQARVGDANAQSTLGLMYAQGRGVRKNDAEAVRWYRAAADQGNAQAQSNLGLMYAEGRGIVQDDAEAVTWYRKAVAQGNADAQVNLGLMYVAGRGVSRDDAKAVSLYRKAAAQGDADAWVDLGSMYAEGRGVAQDDVEAVAWFRKAADQRLAVGQYNLGLMYGEGRGVVQDDAQAVLWYRRAAAQRLAAAQYNLGLMYAEGRGVSKNPAGAVQWYRRAALQGYADAEYSLGLMYAQGRGVRKNDAEAVKWYQKAAQQGNAKAQSNLGLMYAEGRGVPQDAVQAVKWYRKAAEQGRVVAQFNLGWTYAQGRGVQKNTAEAMKWYRKAAAQGDVEAQANLDELRGVNSTAPRQTYAAAPPPVAKADVVVSAPKVQERRTDGSNEVLSSSGWQQPALPRQAARADPDAPAALAPLPSRKVAKIDESPPVISTPDALQAEAASGTATIRGSVQDESEIFSFTIEEIEVNLDASGDFEFPRYLPAGGEQKIELVAIDRFGNRSVRSVTLSRGEERIVEEVRFERLDPTRSKPARRTNPAAALVVGIEDYKRMPDALYARADADIFQDYAHRSLGIPHGRIIRLVDSDADNIGIQDAVRRLGGMTDANTDLYVYFAGHGFASGNGVPYLLPYDGDARYLSQLISREKLFTSLQALKARSVTVFLDTCYSGRGRSGMVLAKGMRPLVIASSDEGVPQGFTVISAAATDEFSGDLPEAEHGLFSYYLMRGLGGEADENGDRTISVEELHGYVAENVGRQASRLGREQTPELYGERDRVLVRY